MSLAELEVLQAQVRATVARGALLGTGPRSGRLHVHLGAGPREPRGAVDGPLR